MINLKPKFSPIYKMALQITKNKAEPQDKSKALIKMYFLQIEFLAIETKEKKNNKVQ